MKHLVIVESPAKAKTIGKILGPEYIVKASVGHIRDLPQHALGVDIEHHFAPQYEISADKKKVVAELLKAASDCDEIYLASDPDREGEAIAWHLHEVLSPKAGAKAFHRVKYNEITKRAVLAAFQDAGDVDMNRVDAQQARRVLDRIVGYKVSPFLWKNVQRGLSAGRVQSVALRLVCEREDAIQCFKPEPYWMFAVSAAKLTEPSDPFTMRLARINGKKASVTTEEVARSVYKNLLESRLTVDSVSEKTVARHAYPPFITSTLQQSASSVIGLPPSKTMSIAQKLYEGMDLGGDTGHVGLITYMRTDSVNISAEAREEAKAYIVQRFGDAYYPAKPNFYKGRETSQDAHEAIRPTSVFRTPESLRNILDDASYKVYALIWRRFVASQMADARLSQKTALATASNPDAHRDAYTFSATATATVFKGHLIVTDSISTKSDDPEDPEDDTVATLPPLEAGESLRALKWMSDRKETKPPNRYSEAALIKELEANGVGRPSTYASIIGTLYQRKYIERQKRAVLPTEIGMRANKALVHAFPDLFDVGYTASMETELDGVENGSEQWTGMMDRFYAKFTEWMAGTPGPATVAAENVTKVLDALDSVVNWNPPVSKNGKRAFDDHKFVQSIRDQLSVGKAVTERQFEVLLRLMSGYRAQIPGYTDVATALERFDLLVSEKVITQAPEIVREKLEWVAKAPLSPDTKKFVESLRKQIDSAHHLSEAQIRVLDEILSAQASHIDGLTTETLEKLGVKPRSMEEIHAIEELLAALESVKEWRPPSQRGKKTYDDKSFSTSVSEQFHSRGDLSPAQLNAVKRMVSRYFKQIPNYAELAQKHGLPPDGLAPSSGVRSRRPKGPKGHMGSAPLTPPSGPIIDDISEENL